MRKILAAAILTTALFIGCNGAEINCADSIYYPRINFYEIISTGDRIISPRLNKQFGGFKFWRI